MELLDKPIKHWEISHREWEDIKTKLLADFGTRILITWVQRRELGFSVREHRRWDKSQTVWEDRSSVICIDFYSEAARTYFLLKYT